MTIGSDALYVNKPFMDACKNHKMDYILRYKDFVMSSIIEEFESVEKTTFDEYEYLNDIGFGCETKKTEETTNVIRYTSKSEEKD